MENRVIKGREFLEAIEPGLYARRVQAVLMAGGVVHLSPDCMLLGMPCEDAPGTLYVDFACAQLHSLLWVLLGLRRYDRVRFKRGLKSDKMYERDIMEYARHAGILDKISEY